MWLCWDWPQRCGLIVWSGLILWLFVNLKVFLYKIEIMFRIFYYDCVFLDVAYYNYIIVYFCYSNVNTPDLFNYIPHQFHYILDYFLVHSLQTNQIFCKFLPSETQKYSNIHSLLIDTFLFYYLLLLYSLILYIFYLFWDNFIICYLYFVWNVYFCSDRVILWDIFRHSMRRL